MYIDLSTCPGIGKEQLASSGYKIIAVDKKFEGKQRIQDNNTALKSSLSLLFDGPSELLKNDSLLLIQRVTLAKVEEAGFIHQFCSLKKPLNTYDLVAVEPSSEKVFNWCCTDAPIDIISLDLTTRQSFYPSFTTVNAAILRGVYFEICWGPLLSLKPGTLERRLLIQNAATYIRVTRGKNLILTSGASSSITMRNPKDVINLGVLLGLSEEQVIASITKNPRLALLHAGKLIIAKLTLQEYRKNVYKSAIKSETVTSQKTTEIIKEPAGSNKKRKLNDKDGLKKSGNEND